MISPHNPGMKGNNETVHGGMCDADHEKQVRHAESNQGGSESAKEEADYGKDKKHSND